MVQFFPSWLGADGHFKFVGGIAAAYILWMLLCITGPVLLITLINRIHSGDFGPFVVPLAAIVVLLCSPGDFAVSKAHAVPLGLIAILCSFGLFAVGTLSALTKHRWHKE